MRTIPGRYRVELHPQAEQELDELRAFDARPVVDAIWALGDHAETQTRNRKPLKEPIPDLPEATWEVRVGDYRILYDVRNDQLVNVLRVIFKGRQTMEDAVGGSRRG